MSGFLDGKLILANQDLREPTFARSVILICRHDEEGAFGLIVNRPTDMSVADALPALTGLPFSAEPLRQGGPVQSDAIFIVHDDDDAGGELVLPGLYYGGDSALLDSLAASADHDDAPRVRFFAGYAGWSEGQLEFEMQRGSWIIADADPDRALAAGGNESWSEFLRSMGGRYALMADAPLDPEAN